MNYDKEVLQAFLEKQLQLFPEKVAETEEEAKAILDEYITKVTTEKEGLYLEFLKWIETDIVGSRDDLAC